jgi:hypothetical protein
MEGGGKAGDSLTFFWEIGGKRVIDIRGKYQEKSIWVNIRISISLEYGKEE